MSDHIPRVSVILPTYNRERFIGDAIRSVQQQTFSDFELIVVDDGSTDGTDEVLGGFDDPRLHCIVQANAGRSHARNVALRMARGCYIAFLDSDDLYLPRKLERQVNFLDTHREFAMVYTSSSCIDGEGRSIGARYGAPVSGHIYQHIALFKPVTVTLPTVMLRREVLDEVGLFDEAMERFEDTDMWRRIARRYLIGALDVATCLVRTHEDNAMQGQDPARIEAALD